MFHLFSVKNKQFAVFFSAAIAFPTLLGEAMAGNLDDCKKKHTSRAAIVKCVSDLAPIPKRSPPLEKKKPDPPPEPILVEIEPKAVIYRTLRENQQFLANISASLIRLNGWRCDSISSMHPLLIGHGFKVGCNFYRYKYKIEDRGGNWEVSLN